MVCMTFDKGRVLEDFERSADQLQLLHHLAGGSMLQHRAAQRDAEAGTRTDDVEKGKSRLSHVTTEGSEIDAPTWK